MQHGRKDQPLHQLVGDSGECGVGGDPFLWENDDIVAIRDLILPGSERFVFDAFDINDQGEIVSYCATPEGNVHVCLLMPVEEPTSDFAALNSQAGTSMVPMEKYRQPERDEFRCQGDRVLHRDQP